jgi:hypothetical protein
MLFGHETNLNEGPPLKLECDDYDLLECRAAKHCPF